MPIFPLILNVKVAEIDAVLARPYRVVNHIRPRHHIKPGDAQKVLALVLRVAFEMLFYKPLKCNEVAKLARVRIGAGKQGDTATERTAQVNPVRVGHVAIIQRGLNG